MRGMTVLTRDRPSYTAVLGAEGVSASTPYVLVDLSDTTNFPHTQTAEVHLLGLHLDTEKHGGGFDVWVGVVTENDATDGSVTWLHRFDLEALNTYGIEPQHREIDFTLGASNPQGVNCAVRSGATPFLISNLTQADNVNWQNDTNRASPAGSTTKPGAGDIVVWVEEVVDDGTLDFTLTAIYETG